MNKVRKIKEADVVEYNSDGELVLTNNAVELIMSYERTKKNIEREYKEYREALLKAMEKNGTKKFENDYITVSYVEEGIRCSVDQDKLFKEYNSVYNDCQKISPVKASVRVRLKGGW